MIPHVSINPVQMTVGDVWDYYETVRDNLARSAEIAKRDLPDGIGLQDSRLFGKSLEDIERLLDEADVQASFFIIAAAEAAIRVDFHKRVVTKGPKDSITRAFRSIYKSRNARERLEEDILNTWSGVVPGAKSDIGVFKGALRFRHWLAHGRYWNWGPKWSHKYDPNALILIVKDLFCKIGLTSN